MASQTCYAPPITLYHGQLGIEATNQYRIHLYIEFTILPLKKGIILYIVTSLATSCSNASCAIWEPNLKLIERSAISFSDTS